MSTTQVPRQRAIIDRRRLASEIGSLVEEHGEQARGPVVQLLKTALDKGRAELESRLEAKPSAGHENAGGFAFLIDQLIRVIHDHATTHLYPSANRSQAERLTVIAVGGYGRAEMSPHSDVDVAFLVPANMVCNQTMGLVARTLERAGISTVTLSTAREITEQVKVPRSIFVNHPFGRTLGKAGDKEGQHAIMMEMVHALKSLQRPGKMIESAARWEGLIE